MKFLVFLPLFAALLVTSCGEKSSPEGSDSAGASAEPSADAAKQVPTESPGKEPSVTLPLSDADVERLLKEAVDTESLEERNDLFYLDDKPYSGWAKRMYDSGQVQGLGQLKDGKQHGLTRVWADNGQKVREETYKDGKPDGLWTGWHENGQKAAEATFKDGKEASVKYWNSKGEEVEAWDEALEKPSTDPSADTAEILNGLLAQVKEDSSARNLPTTEEEANILLGAGISLKSMKKEQREAIYQRLLIAEGSGVNLDKLIAGYAGNEDNQMTPDIRIKFFQVIQGRKSPDALPFLIKHARNSSRPDTASAALKAVRKLANDSNVSDLLSIIQFNESSTVRQEAKLVVMEISERSTSRDELASSIKSAYDNATSDNSKVTFLELLGSTGGDTAAGIVMEALKSEAKKTRIAALAALGNWADDSQFGALLDHMADEEDDTLRNQAFRAALRFLREDRERDALALEGMWQDLAQAAVTESEKKQVITGLTKIVEDWSFAVVEHFNEDENDEVNFHAEKAIERMTERRDRLKPNRDEDDGE